MISKVEAIIEKEFHSPDCVCREGKNEDGHSVLWTRNGSTKTFVRDRERFEIPLKKGLYSYGRLTEKNAGGWHVAAQCPHPPRRDAKR